MWIKKIEILPAPGGRAMFVITVEPTGVFNVGVNPEDKHWDYCLPNVFVLALIVDRGVGRAQMLTSMRSFLTEDSEAEKTQMEARALSWLNLQFELWWSGTLTDQELKQGFDDRHDVSKRLLHKFGFNPSGEVTRAELDRINALFQAMADEYWDR